MNKLIGMLVCVGIICLGAQTEAKAQSVISRERENSTRVAQVTVRGVVRYPARVREEPYYYRRRRHSPYQGNIIIRIDGDRGIDVYRPYRRSRSYRRYENYRRGARPHRYARPGSRRYYRYYNRY